MIYMHPDLVKSLDTPGGLQTALQTAIKLEHATIPTYLYAMFSIKPGSNSSIENLISSVVIEEMLHMSLACNILNAIGGSPVIDELGFIPNYPTHLPGTVEHQLMVPLAPFSYDLIKNVFMVIEEPEDPQNFPSKALADAADGNKTIGWFYDTIKQRLHDAGPSIWVGDQSRQVTYQYMPELTEVYDYNSAAAAIKLIVDQGEGTTTNPMEPGSAAEPAHYYRFEEIIKGNKLVADPNSPLGYSYSGDPIPFDSTGVYPTIINPKASVYPAGTQARYACDTFNYTYTTLLKCLHSAFNGNPAQLDDALGIMESLKEQAVDLMTFDAGNGTTAGPSFEYQPTNP